MVTHRRVSPVIWSYLVAGWGFFVLTATAMGILDYCFNFFGTSSEGSKNATVLGFIVLLSLIALILVCILILLLLNRQLTRVQLVTSPTVVIHEMTELLRRAESSLYYYGAVGFVGESRTWRDALRSRLATPNFNVTRLIDLTACKQVLDGLQGTGEDADTIIEQYNGWLDTHKEYVASKYRSTLYDIDGAPVWRYAIHLLIFDRRHVVLVFPSDTSMQKSAVIVRDCGEKAEKLQEGMDSLLELLGKRPLTADDLEGAKYPICPGNDNESQGEA